MTVIKIGDEVQLPAVLADRRKQPPQSPTTEGAEQSSKPTKLLPTRPPDVADVVAITPVSPAPSPAGKTEDEF